eukprot:IDg19016t1
MSAALSSYRTRRDLHALACRPAHPFDASSAASSYSTYNLQAYDLFPRVLCAERSTLLRVYAWTRARMSSLLVNYPCEPRRAHADFQNENYYSKIC